MNNPGTTIETTTRTIGVLEAEATDVRGPPPELPPLLFPALLPPPPVLLVADAISVSQTLVAEPTIVVGTHEPTIIAPTVGVRGIVDSASVGVGRSRDIEENEASAAIDAVA